LDFKGLILRTKYEGKREYEMKKKIKQQYLTPTGNEIMSMAITCRYKG
jgi:hypothetical protein